MHLLLALIMQRHSAVDSSSCRYVCLAAEPSLGMSSSCSTRLGFEVDFLPCSSLQADDMTPLNAAIFLAVFVFWQFQEENKSSMAIDPLYATYHYSHPPFTERLEAIDRESQLQKKKVS